MREFILRVFRIAVFIFIFSSLFISKTKLVRAGSTCSPPCSSGLTCDTSTGTCVNLQNNGNNCGNLGQQCPSGTSCVNGTCVSSSCFPAGTKISLPQNQTKNIENVKVGDTVLSEDGTGKQSVSTVTATYQPISGSLCTIKYTDGEQLQVTKGHPLFTGNGWKAIDINVAATEDPGVPVSTLSIGDFMKKDTSSWKQISNISCVNETVQTYNLTVDNNHDYYTEGFLAHNKGCQCGATTTTSCAKSCPPARQNGSCGRAKDGTIKTWCTLTQCNPCPTCSTTAPTGITVTATSPTSATISWTPGSGGVSQTIYGGTDRTAVEANCPAGAGAGKGCDVAVANLPAAQSSYATGNVLTSGSVYYWRIVNFNNVNCFTNSATTIAVSSCLISPSYLNLNSGSLPQTVTTSINSSTDISSVNFSSANASIASVNPASDTTYQYQTVVSPVAVGTTTITSNVIIGGVIACTNTIGVNVLPPVAWWQVKDSDIATNGDLASQPAGNNLFGLPGGGGYPGVPAYGGATNLTNTNVSATGWLANSGITSPKNFDYHYFLNQIPVGTVINTITNTTIGNVDLTTGQIDPSTGYYWYKYDGSGNNSTPLTIGSNINVGSSKVIILVGSADLDINANINLTKGQGFFMAIVGVGSTGNGGNIIVSPSVGGGGVPNLEGIYEADGAFKDGTLTPATDSELWVRGSVAAYGGAALNRDLGGVANITTPAEFFEFAPDQVMLIPKILDSRKINWKEVAP